MFLKRSYRKEIMDDFSIVDERIERALVELEYVNKFLGGVSATKAGMKFLLNGKAQDEITVLDIGAGASDMFKHLSDTFPSLKVFSIDRNKGICRVIKRNNNALPVFGDAVKLPFKDESFSVVHASLFLHHFNGEEIKDIISAALSVSKDGVVINDLRRSVFALLAIKILTALFSKSKMVKNDAPLSVRKGFIKSELKNIMNELNIKDYNIKRKWAHRWLIVIPKEKNEQ